MCNSRRILGRFAPQQQQRGIEVPQQAPRVTSRMPPSNDRFAAGAAASEHSEADLTRPRGAAFEMPVSGAIAVMRDRPDAEEVATATGSARAGARATELRPGGGAAGMDRRFDYDSDIGGDEGEGVGSGGRGSDRTVGRPHGAKTTNPTLPRHPQHQQQQHPAAVTMALDSSHDAFPACPPPGPGAPLTSEAGGRGVLAGCSGDGGSVGDSQTISAAAEVSTEIVHHEQEKEEEMDLAGLPPSSLSWSPGSSHDSLNSRGQRLSKASTGIELEGNTVATAGTAAAAAAAIVSPEVVGGRVRPDLLGSRSDGSSSRDYGGMIGPASPLSQALHIALALVVLMLVAFAKADTPYDEGASYGGGGSSSGGNTPRNPGSTPSRRRRSRQSGQQGSGGDVTQQNPGVGPAKRRRLSSGKISSRGGNNSVAGAGDAFPWSPTLRRLRAAWSKLWHLVEDDLAGRWRTAGGALASLRQAWSALWMLPPHPEADVLAEALASSLRRYYSQGTADRRPASVRAGHRSGAGVGSAGGSGGGGSERRRRRSACTGNGRGSIGRQLGTADSGSLSDKGGNGGRPVGLNCLNFLSLCGYRPGGGRGSRRPKFLLLLDLDETLVHCSPHLMEPARRRSGGGGGKGGGRLRPDLKLEMRGRAPSDNRPSCMYAWKRPHLDVFLDVVSRWYEVAVFTSGRQSFAEVRNLIRGSRSRCL